MKCVGIQYIETIRKYIKEKLVFDRTIHMSFVPGLCVFIICINIVIISIIYILF